MDKIKLTEEERQACIAIALKAKEEKTKGTSLENKDKGEEVLEMSPELERALENGLTTALDKIFERESKKRADEKGEGYNQARAVIGDAVDQARERKARQRQEDAFCSSYFTGAFHRDRDMQKKALDDECKYLGRDTGMVKAFEERAMGGSTAGDELVPEVFASRLIENIEQHGVARRECTIIPMTTDTHKFPKVSTGLTAYEVSAGAQITASDLVTAQLTMNTRKLATITALQNELLANANPAIVPLLIDMAGRALANKEDTMCLTGASSSVTGVLESATNNVYLGDSSTSGATTIASVDFDDLARLIDELDSQYIGNNAKYYMNKKAIYHLQLLKNSADYYWKVASAANPGTIHGFQYVTSSVMSSAPAVDTAFMFFGDLRNMWMGDRNLFEVAIGKEGTVGSDNMFEKDMSAVRVIEHIEFEIADDEGLAVLKTAAS